MNDIPKTLIISSGGIDSIMLIYLFVNRGHIVDVMYFSYGQTPDEKEYEYLKQHIDRLNMDRDADINLIRVPLQLNWSKSGMLNGEINNDYVEMRNLIFLSYALSYAQANGYKNIAIGLTNDYLTVSYPDNSKEFADNFRRIANSVGIELLTPFIDWDKLEIVNFAINLFGLDINDYKKLFWYCNTPKKVNNEIVACGECYKCKFTEELIEYFKTNNI